MKTSSDWCIQKTLFHSSAANPSIEETRDTSSFGWHFEKSNKEHVNKLIHVLLKMFRRDREPSSVPLALSNSPLVLEDSPLALQDRVVSS